jgi:hypothetical protein
MVPEVDLAPIPPQHMVVVEHSGTVEFELHVNWFRTTLCNTGCVPVGVGSLDVQSCLMVPVGDLKCQSHRSTWVVVAEQLER